MARNKKKFIIFPVKILQRRTLNRSSPRTIPDGPVEALRKAMVAVASDHLCGFFNGAFPRHKSLLVRVVSLSQRSKALTMRALLRSKENNCQFSTISPNEAASSAANIVSSVGVSLLFYHAAKYFEVVPNQAEKLARHRLPFFRYKKLQEMVDDRVEKMVSLEASLKEVEKKDSVRDNKISQLQISVNGLEKKDGMFETRIQKLEASSSWFSFSWFTRLFRS